MGLVKKDFVLKENGNFILPNAYAYITECYSGRKSGYAIIGIFADRESAVNGAKPFQSVRVDFILDRNENDRVTAYKQAKMPVFIDSVWNKETKQYENVYEPSIFADWQDDIVEE